MLSVAEKEPFLNAIKKLPPTLKLLKTKTTLQELERFENELTLNELEDCISNTNIEELQAKVKEFFRLRWERIRGSSMCYTQQPFNKVNQLCLELALVFSPPIRDLSEIEALEPNTGPYCLLMPSLENSEDVYGQNIHTFKLHEFVTSDQERVFIPILDCLQQASQSTEGELLQQVLIDGACPKLTDSEIKRVSEHSTQTAELYQSMLAVNKRRLLGNDLGAKLNQLAQALRKGGSRGSGRELDAGTEANLGILTFNNYWEGLSAEQKAAILAKYPELENLIGRLFRPNDDNYKETRFCVELIAAALDPIIQVCNRELSIQQLQQKVESKENDLKIALENPQNLVTPLRNSRPPKHILPLIFKLSASEQKQIFKHENYNSALRYALAKDPEALTQFHLDEKTQQQVRSSGMKRYKNAGLILAAKEGNTAAIKLLLSWGAELKAKDGDGKNALGWATINNHVDAINCLIEQGVSLEATTNQGNTALHLAVYRGHRAAVELLLKKGARINARNKAGKNALDIALSQHPELMELILKQLATQPLPQQTNALARLHNRPPNVFFYAIASNTFLPLANQIQSQFTPIEWETAVTLKDKYKNTALHMAGFNGNREAINYLLEHGAQLEALNNNQTTPLHCVVLGGERSALEPLLKKANFKTRSWYGNNALDLAIKNSPQLVEPILRQIATLSLPEQKECLSKQSYSRYVSGKKVDSLYPDILWYAIVNKVPLTNEMLSELSKEKWDTLIKTKDKRGLTALHSAAVHGNTEAIRCLLEHGAELEALSYHHNNALNSAVLNGTRGAVDLLLKRSNLNARNNDGDNALDLAIKHHPELVEPILMHLATLPISEQMDCLVNVPNGPYPSVFLYTAVNKPELLPAITQQIKTVSDSNQWETLLKDSDSKEFTALHWAAQNDDVEALNFLFEQGASIEALDHNKNTALHVAIKKQRKAAAELLLTKSNLNIRDINGNNALELASKHFPDLIEPILKQLLLLPFSEQKAYLANVEDGAYPNVFLYAASRGLLRGLLKQTLRQLNAEQRQELITSVDKNGLTTLHWAAQKGERSTIKCLLKLGAQLDATTILKNTPLHCAIVNGKRAVVKKIITNSTLKSQNIEGNNALDLAIKHHPQLLAPILTHLVTQPLLEQKECLLNAKGGPYPNAFFYAATQNSPILQNILSSFNNSGLDSHMQGIQEHIHHMGQHYQKMKRKASTNSNYRTAVLTAEALLTTCTEELLQIYQNSDNDNLDIKMQEFKTNCKKAIETARPVLAEHREWSGMLAAFLLRIITLPVSIPLSLCGLRFFSLKTHSEKLLDNLHGEVNKPT